MSEIQEKITKLNNKGVQFFMAGKFPEAEKEYQKALEIESGHATTLNNLGMLKLQQKEFETALSLFDKALSEVEKPVYYLNKGHAYANLNKLNEAEKNYRKCIELDAKHVMGWVSLAKLYNATGHFRQAVSHWKKAIQIEENPEFLTELAKSLINAGELNEAQTVLLRALEHGKNIDVISYYLGLAAFHQKNFGLAKSEVKKSLSEYPDNTTYRELLAAVFLGMGEFSSAVEEWKKILKLEPDNTKARTDLAVALLGNGFTKEAEKQLDSVLKLNPDYPKALYYRGVLQSKTNPEEALKLFRKIAQTNSPYRKNAKIMMENLNKNIDGGK